VTIEAPKGLPDVSSWPKCGETDFQRALTFAWSFPGCLRVHDGFQSLPELEMLSVRTMRIRESRPIFSSLHTLAFSTRQRRNLRLAI